MWRDLDHDRAVPAEPGSAPPATMAVIGLEPARSRHERTIGVEIAHDRVEVSPFVLG